MKPRKWNLRNMIDEDYTSLETILGFAQTKNQMLTFRVGNEIYGVEISKIIELVRLDLENLPKPMPKVPDFILGVINVRGEIIPVLDLRKKLLLPQKEFDKFDVIIVLESSDEKLGILVDEVNDVVPIPNEKKSPPPDYIENIDTRFIFYICESKKTIVSLINPDMLLDKGFEKELRQP